MPSNAVAQQRGITLRAVWRVLPAVLRSSLKAWWSARRHGVTARFYDSSSMIDNEVGRSLFQDYLPGALAAGSFRPAPPPRIAGRGLQSLQAAFDLQRAGVSAEKVVVLLD